MRGGRGEGGRVGGGGGGGGGVGAEMHCSENLSLSPS